MLPPARKLPWPTEAGTGDIPVHVASISASFAPLLQGLIVERLGTNPGVGLSACDSFSDS